MTLLAALLSSVIHPRAGSSTNTAVDQALTATDAALQSVGRSRAGMDEIRSRCKRVGLHFIASNYKGREHLLFARSEPIAELTELEANRPDSSDDRAYASGATLSS